MYRNHCDPRTLKAEAVEMATNETQEDDNWK